MSAWKLFDGPVAWVSTAEFHRDRRAAAHLEDPGHRGRMDRAADFIAEAARNHRQPATVSDLGCGDGGLLSLVQQGPDIEEAWGYDFCPAYLARWVERGVTARQADVFGADRDLINIGDIAATTEVLEHLTDPHGAAAWIGTQAEWLVASSPWDETDQHHDECHAWAWDHDGYRELIEGAGWSILRHDTVHRFQVVLARRP